MKPSSPKENLFDEIDSGPCSNIRAAVTQAEPITLRQEMLSCRVKRSAPVAVARSRDRCKTSEAALTKHFRYSEGRDLM